MTLNPFLIYLAIEIFIPSTMNPFFIFIFAQVPSFALQSVDQRPLSHPTSDATVQYIIRGESPFKS